MLRFIVALAQRELRDSNRGVVAMCVTHYVRRFFHSDAAFLMCLRDARDHDRVYKSSTFTCVHDVYAHARVYKHGRGCRYVGILDNVIEADAARGRGRGRGRVNSTLKDAGAVANNVDEFAEVFSNQVGSADTVAAKHAMHFPVDVRVQMIAIIIYFYLAFHIIIYSPHYLTTLTTTVTVFIITVPLATYYYVEITVTHHHSS